MNMRKNNQGLVIVEDGLDQWLGSENEFLSDFLVPFNPEADAPTRAEFEQAVNSRKLRNPITVSAPTADEIIAAEFRYRGRRALLRFLAIRFGITELQLVTELKSLVD